MRILQGAHFVFLLYSPDIEHFEFSNPKARIRKNGEALFGV